MRTEDNVRAKLLQLKRCHVPEQNSIAFMFACCSRGSFYYNEADVESRVFRAVFPHTPLLGVFGYGEICHDYLPDYTNPVSVQQWRDKKITDDVHHSFTTVFVLLSVGEQDGHRVV